ncbi:MAG: hypothetical protein ACRELC_09560, partial [Gemmatimonadota bacterium]
LALNRGRPTQALEWRRRELAQEGPAQRHGLAEVFDALYWGGDSTVAAEAVRERGYVDEAVAPVGAPDPLAPLYTDLCAVSLWRIGMGELARVGRAIGLLEDAARRAVTWQAAFPRLCAAIADAELAVATGRPDARAAVDRLDSLSATGLPTSGELLAGASLSAARLLAQRGDHDRALDAVRRRGYATEGSEVALSTFFRDEGRLSVVVGDTAGAIRAYRAYLNLRSDPEPAAQAQADRVRAELARLLPRANRETSKPRARTADPTASRQELRPAPTTHVSGRASPYEPADPLTFLVRQPDFDLAPRQAGVEGSDEAGMARVTDGLGFAECLSEPRCHLLPPPQSLPALEMSCWSRKAPRTTLTADQQAHALTGPTRSLGDLAHRHEIVGLEMHHPSRQAGRLDRLGGREDRVCERFGFSIEVQILDSPHPTHGRIVTPRLEQGVHVRLVLQVRPLDDQCELVLRHRFSSSV